MHAAQVKELVAQSVWFARLMRNRLQRKCQFAQPRRLGPALPSPSSLISSRSENSPRRPRAHSSRQARSCSANTLLSVSNWPSPSRLVNPYASLLHSCYFPRIAASTSSAVCGRSASRSMSLPSAPTRKSHSMRTPIFSSGMYTPGSIVNTIPGFNTAG